MGPSALTWRRTAHQPGPVGQRLLGVKGCRFSGEALTDDPGLGVDKNGHANSLM